MTKQASLIARLREQVRRLQRIPREPTEAMQEAGRREFFVEDSPGLKRREMLRAVRKMWRAMYDAAPVRSDAAASGQGGNVCFTCGRQITNSALPCLHYPEDRHGG